MRGEEDAWSRERPFLKPLTSSKDQWQTTTTGTERDGGRERERIKGKEEWIQRDTSNKTRPASQHTNAIRRAFQWQTLSQPKEAQISHSQWQRVSVQSDKSEWTKSGNLQTKTHYVTNWIQQTKLAADETQLVICWLFNLFKCIKAGPYEIPLSCLHCCNGYSHRTIKSTGDGRSLPLSPCEAQRHCCAHPIFHSWAYWLA